MPTTTNTSKSSDHFGGMSPFKVQVNFDIPISEGQIDVDALEKWVNLLEGYFSVYSFYEEKISLFPSLRLSPLSMIGWKLIVSKTPQRNFN